MGGGDEKPFADGREGGEGEVVVEARARPQGPRPARRPGEREAEDRGPLAPEDHGTYSIDPRGRITFNYADGHVVVETIAVMLNSGDSPDANCGLLLGESAYFGPDSEVGS